MPLDGSLYEPDDPILRVLRDAQEQIRDPEHWCQGFIAMKANSVPCNGGDNDAIRWCALGALGVFEGHDSAFTYLGKSANEMGYPMISSLNNATDHPTVMAMFQRAIEMRRAEIMEAAHA